MSLNIDRAFVAAILREGRGDFSRIGITTEMMQGDGQAALKFVETYWREHSALPTLEVLRDQIGVYLGDQPKDPSSFWAAEIDKRFVDGAIQSAMSHVLEVLETADPLAAKSAYEKGFFELQKIRRGSGSSVQSIFGDISSILASYERAKGGYLGIPCGFPTVDNKTLGWQPEDMIIIGGRPSVGKTQLMILMGLHAWQVAGKRVLFVSTEMSEEAIKRRFVGFALKLPYEKLRAGALSDIQEQALREGLRRMENDPNLLMMWKEMSPTLEDVETACMLSRPDLVCVDGFYLMKSKLIKSTNRGRSEYLSELLDRNKDMLKRLGIPMIISTQLNRPPSGGRNGNSTKVIRPELDRLAFSDNMGMIASWVFFLDQSEPLRRAKLMKLMAIKTRESSFIPDILMNWNFDDHDFSESDRKEDDIADDAPKTKSAARAYKDDDEDRRAPVRPAGPW